MIARIEEKNFSAIKILLEEEGKTIGWAYLYLIRNDLHKEPYGFLENVFIEEQYRGRGLGSMLVSHVVEEAKKLGCYKIIGTSRNEKTDVHKFYERLGFKNYGLEFRIDLVDRP